MTYPAWRTRVVFIVETPDRGVRRYPADTYAVRLEFGALVVYFRQVPTLVAGDNDIPLYAYGNGYWQRFETVVTPPVGDEPSA